MVSSGEYPQFDFTLQPTKINVSNYQLMNLLDFYFQLKIKYDFYSKKLEKNKIFDNIENLEKFYF